MDFVVPDQVIDRTKGIRPFTFFEGGVVGHVGFADPFDAGLADVVKRCAQSMEGDGVVLHEKGTVVVMGKIRLCLALFLYRSSNSSRNIRDSPLTVGLAPVLY